MVQALSLSLKVTYMSHGHHSTIMLPRSHAWQLRELTLILSVPPGKAAHLGHNLINRSPSSDVDPEKEKMGKMLNVKFDPF
jgi:hypothetical protein